MEIKRPVSDGGSYFIDGFLGAKQVEFPERSGEDLIELFPGCRLSEKRWDCYFKIEPSKNQGTIRFLGQLNGSKAK